MLLIQINTSNIEGYEKASHLAATLLKSIRGVEIKHFKNRIFCGYITTRNKTGVGFTYQLRRVNQQESWVALCYERGNFRTIESVRNLTKSRQKKEVAKTI